MRSATILVQVNGSNVWRKAVLALCASLVGVALAFIASPPGTSITDPPSVFGVHRVTGW
jgi:hypothetical protein